MGSPTGVRLVNRPRAAEDNGESWHVAGDLFQVDRYGGNAPPQDPLQSTSPASPEAVREQLQRIVASRIFSRAERSSHLLRFLVEKALGGAGIELGEHLIAVEVLGRSASFTPDTDAIVRVEAGRLRQRLQTYYQELGDKDPVKIDLPA